MKNWKVFAIFVLVLAVFLVIIMFVFLPKAWTGDIYIHSVSIDQASRFFIDQFKRELLDKKKSMERVFIGDYFVTVYAGSLPDKDTGELKSAIGIFITERNFDFDDDKPVIKIWSSELFSGEEIMKKAKKAAVYIFQLLQIIEQQKKNSIKIPV